MRNITMIGNKISLIDMKVEVDDKMQDNSPAEYEGFFNFDLHFGEDNKTCNAVFEQELKSKQYPEKIKIRFIYEGLFLVEKGFASEEDKKKTHVECYKSLFPYVQNLLFELSNKAGLGGISINAIDLDPAEVKLNQGL